MIRQSKRKSARQAAGTVKRDGALRFCMRDCHDLSFCTTPLSFCTTSGPTTRQTKSIKMKTLWEQGYSKSYISKAVGCGIATVQRWTPKFKKAEAQGIPDNVAVLDKPRSGAPPKITKSIGKAILRYTEGKPGRQVPAIVTYIRNKFEVSLDESSIRKWLKKEGLKPYHRPKRLPLSEAHKKKRAKFAIEYKSHDWRNTLFTDESQFPLVP
jgi:transposase